MHRHTGACGIQPLMKATNYVSWYAISEEITIKVSFRPYHDRRYGRIRLCQPYLSVGPPFLFLCRASKSLVLLVLNMAATYINYPHVSGYRHHKKLTFSILLCCHGWQMETAARKARFAYFQTVIHWIRLFIIISIIGRTRLAQISGHVPSAVYCYWHLAQAVLFIAIAPPI